MYIIPTTSAPNQRFRCVIPVDGENLALAFVFRFNTEAGYWFMSVEDDLNGECLIDALPLFSGEYPSADILGQYTYLRIGSAVIVKVNPDAEGDVPGADNFGTDFVLVWGDTVL